MVNVRKSLVGEKFGKLTVLEQVEDYVSKKGQHEAQWLCLCECGNTTIVNGANLKNGHIRSCGCIKASRENLIGQQFGKLTVIEQAEDYIYSNGNHQSRWVCLCECGNIITTYGNALKSGRTKSCGCSTKENLVGKVFGKLTVIAQVEKPDARSNICRYWLCQCECGKQSIVSTADLTSNHVMSCGCLRNENASRSLIGRNIASAGMGKKNKRTQFHVEGEYAYGFTSNTQKKFYIDLDDVELASKYTWHENDQGYIMSRIDNSLVRLHRLLTNCPDDMDVDHRNHNTYDNRKSNLRVVTHSQNSMNRNAKGVCYDKSHDRYIAYLTVDYEQKLFEYFRNESEALEARKAAEEKYFGEFSYSNSINDTIAGES